MNIFKTGLHDHGWLMQERLSTSGPMILIALKINFCGCDWWFNSGVSPIIKPNNIRDLWNKGQHVFLPKCLQTSLSLKILFDFGPMQVQCNLLGGELGLSMLLATRTEERCEVVPWNSSIAKLLFVLRILPFGRWGWTFNQFHVIKH